MKENDLTSLHYKWWRRRWQQQHPARSTSYAQNQWRQVVQMAIHSDKCDSTHINPPPRAPSVLLFIMKPRRPDKPAERMTGQWVITDCGKSQHDLSTAACTKWPIGTVIPFTSLSSHTHTAISQRYRLRAVFCCSMFACCIDSLLTIYNWGLFGQYLRIE